MDKNRKRTRKSLPDDGIRRYLYFAAIPVVVFVLIAVILHSDKKKDTAQETEAVAMTQSETKTGESSALDETEMESEDPTDVTDDESLNSESEDGTENDSEEKTVESEKVSDYTLKQDEMPELTALIQSYCQAKTDCDPEALEQLFGVSDLSEAQIAAEREKMELVKASIKAYKNISCYSIEGAETDSYVIFPYFEIQYRKAKTLMPVLTWGYVKKNEDGQYRMVKELSEAEKKYIQTISEREDVQELQSQVKDAGAQAISEDEVLKQVYESAGSSEVTIGKNEQQ